ncbi:MAG: ATP-binding cassette domain-containing protein [Clostridium sp.]
MKLEIVDLCKSFGENKVLNNVNLVAKKGKALGLLGRNGAGKTTSIRIIMGIFPQDLGQVLINGVPIDREKIKIGYLPEERGLYPKKKVLEQITYFGQLQGMKAKDAKESGKTLLEKLKITEYTNKRLDTLSKGNQQKVQLVVALIADPEIVILDEPFSGLDPVNSIILKDVVKELIENGKVVIFSSHQMNYVEEFCDNIAILNNGEIVLSGNIHEIKRGYNRDKIIVTTVDILNVKDYIENNLKHIINNVIVEDGSIIVELKSADKKRELMLEILKQDFDIDRICVLEPSLNDIFIKYTEDRI